MIIRSVGSNQDSSRSLKNCFPWLPKSLNPKISGNNRKNQLHFLWVHSRADIFTDTNFTNIMNCFEQAMERNGFGSAIISSLEIYNRRCITKKRFNIKNGFLCEENVTKNKKRDDDSFGKNLEVLMRKLRNGEMLGLGRTRSINSYYFDDEFIFIDEKIPLTGRFAEEGLKIEYEDFLDFFF